MPQTHQVRCYAGCVSGGWGRRRACCHVLCGRLGEGGEGAFGPRLQYGRLCWWAVRPGLYVPVVHTRVCTNAHPAVWAAAAQFGFAVATDGERIVVGCPFGSLGTGATAQSGKVYVFRGPNWSTAVPVTISAPDAAISDYFGYSVAVSGCVPAV
jgi:hypothetical protein